MSNEKNSSRKITRSEIGFEPLIQNSPELSEAIEVTRVHVPHKINYRRNVKEAVYQPDEDGVDQLVGHKIIVEHIEKTIEAVAIVLSNGSSFWL